MRSKKSFFEAFWIIFIITIFNNSFTVSGLSSCLIPRDKHSMIIKNALTDNEIKIGSLISEYTLLRFYCKTGYVLKGFNNTFCGKEGKWDKPLPTCLKFCKRHDLRNGFSTDINFELNGIDVSNADEFEPGTIAKIRCSHGFVQPENFHDILQCTNDGWQGIEVGCNMQCGQPAIPITPFSRGGQTTNITEFPWHVGIYKKRNDIFEHICGGTLISPRLVISAAHCFSHNTKLNLTTYIVAAGKYVRDYDSNRELNTTIIERRNIADIWIPPDYNGKQNNFNGDLAIITLQHFIKFSETIRPICLYPNGNLDYTIFSHGSGKLCTYNQLSASEENVSTLKALPMSTVSLSDCNATLYQELKMDIPNDKFCVSSYFANAFACRGDSGSGFVIQLPNTNTFVLNGIVSFSPTVIEECSRFNLLVMTNIFYYQKIIEKFIKKDLDNDNDETYTNLLNTNVKQVYCTVPRNKYFMNIRNGQTRKKINLGSKVPVDTPVHFSCNHGYNLRGPDYVVCGKGGVWKNTLPICAGFCSDTFICGDISLKVSFELYGKHINFATYFEKDTIAKLSCMNGFIEPVKDFPKLVECKHKVWKPRKKSCILVCGNVAKLENNSSDANATIINEAPWHISIYKEIDNNNYEYACSGTLISPRLVVTAAHCFLQSQISAFNTDKEYMALFLAIAGKYADKDKMDFSRSEQRSIVEIFTTRKYINSDSYGDIAILTLNEVLPLSAAIQPACLHFPEINDKMISPFEIGQMTTWSTNKENSKLQTFLMSRIKEESCQNALVHQSLNQGNNTFCITGINDQPCYADIGSGFLVKTPNTNTFALYGVLNAVSQNSINGNQKNSFLMTNILDHKNVLNYFMFKDLEYTNIDWEKYKNSDPEYFQLQYNYRDESYG